MRIGLIFVGEYTTNLSGDWDAANATQTDIAGNFISQKQIMIDILEQFAPLLGLT